MRNPAPQPGAHGIEFDRPDADGIDGPERFPASHAASDRRAFQFGCHLAVSLRSVGYAVAAHRCRRPSFRIRNTLSARLLVPRADAAYQVCARAVSPRPVFDTA